MCQPLWVKKCSPQNVKWQLLVSGFESSLVPIGRILFLPVMQLILTEHSSWARLSSLHLGHGSEKATPFAHGAHILIYQAFSFLGSGLWNPACQMSLPTEQSDPEGLGMPTGLANQLWEKLRHTLKSAVCVNHCNVFLTQPLFRFQEPEIKMFEFKPCCKVKKKKILSPLYKGSLSLLFKIIFPQ